MISIVVLLQLLKIVFIFIRGRELDEPLIMHHATCDNHLSNGSFHSFLGRHTSGDRSRTSFVGCVS